MQKSVFTRIIDGEIPCHKVYEDELTIAIIPLYPIAVGHVLVISKTQVDEFFELNERDYLALMQTVKKVAKRMKEILGTKRVGLQVIGVDVAHVHIHVVAFNNIDEYKENRDETVPVDELELARLASLLAF